MRRAEGRPATPAGLCASCVHAKLVRSSRGLDFILCRLALTDAAFARYPTLPVVACRGYECEPDAEPT